MWAVYDGKLESQGAQPGVQSGPGGVPEIETNVDTFTPPVITVGGAEVTGASGSYSQVGSMIWVPMTEKQMTNSATYAKWQYRATGPAHGLYYSKDQPAEWVLPKPGEGGNGPMFAVRQWNFKWCYDKASPNKNYDAKQPLPEVVGANSVGGTNGNWSVDGKLPEK